MDSEKSMNSFETKKDKLPYYLLDRFFTNFLTTFRKYYHVKCLSSLIWLIYFILLLISVHGNNISVIMDTSHP